MFKKFTDRENISGSQQLKSTVQKSIRQKIIEQYPKLEPYLENVLPKKDNFKIIKCHDHIELLAVSSGEILFFKDRDGPFIPTLKLLHQYPFMMTSQKVDKGAIKFLLNGSNIMCPGLISSGGALQDADKDTLVCIVAEGKQHPIGVGKMLMSSDDIRSINKGHGIETLHYLNDGLWHMKSVK